MAARLQGSFRDPAGHIFVSNNVIYRRIDSPGRAAYEQLMTSGLFHDDVMVSDYAASRNLFGQGKAAMFLMGSWELGLGTDKGFAEEFRANVDAFKFPTVKDGKGGVSLVQ